MYVALHWGAGKVLIKDISFKYSSTNVKNLLRRRGVMPLPLVAEGTLLAGGGAKGTFPFISGVALGGIKLARGGGGGRTAGSASDKARTRGGGAGGPLPVGGLRAGGGGTALTGEAGPVLDGRGGGGGGGLPGVVGTCLLGA